MKKPITLLYLLAVSSMLFAQIDPTDSSAMLPDITIRAYEQGRKLKDIPAPVGFVGRSELNRFHPVSIVNAVSSIPGIRMEERSPGSYRISIRGSSLRSPFGVRNVKMYYNDIPVTDPGGQTFLNQFAPASFQSLEIIKGPASSLYGAGTGGAILAKSAGSAPAAGAVLQFNAGSFDYRDLYASVTTKSEKSSGTFGYQHQQNSGYRDHSELQRDLFSWTGNFLPAENAVLTTSFLYGELFYETPGALTLTEYDQNPRGARPAAGGFPGSATARASIRQRTVIAGASYEQQLSSKWKNKTVLYGMFTELRNPTIRNYEKSALPHYGGRSFFQFKETAGAALIDLTVGGEWQQGAPSVHVHKTNNGNPDSLRTTDEIRNSQQLVFAQLGISYNSWLLTTGISYNKMQLEFERFNPAPSGKQKRKLGAELAPRVALLKKFRAGNSELNLYTGVSKGFSPPSTAELLPTGGAVNLGLNPESGTNYDAGLKAVFANGLFVDINAFVFALQNTIVQRRDISGGDYFINAGSTRQHGIETYINYTYRKDNATKGNVWASHTWHRFRYREFLQLTNDFSGKRLPGVAPHTITAGVDYTLTRGLQAAITYLFSDKTPLNDGNTAYANSYHLLGARIGYWLPIRSVNLQLSAGAENLLDQRYSLGNDINGFGGRYYNAAPGRNFFAGIRFSWTKRTNE